MKKFVLSVLLSGALVSPAAAASITFTNNALGSAGFTAEGVPTYTTASVVEGFQQSGSTFTTGLTNTTGTETLTVPRFGSAQLFNDSGATSMVGKYLSLFNGASYKLDFGVGSPVQFVSFLLDNYSSNNTVNITLSNGSVQTNVLSGVSGLLNGRDGVVAFNQQGGFGIRAIEFVAGNGTSFAIDQIAAAAPEPATWGMMLLGFGLVGSQLRRRRPKVSFAMA